MGLTGDPKSVFNRKMANAQVGTVKGSCDVIPTVDYDGKSSMMTISYTIEEFTTSSLCMSAFDITNETIWFGETWGHGIKDFVIRVDMSSLVTACAINQGILPTYELEMIPYTEYFIQVDGVDHLSAIFFYPYFSDMDPLHCVYREPYNSTSSPSDIYKTELFCATQIAGYYYGIPVFNHMGRDYTEPTPCECSDDEEVRWICNTFQFVSGFVFYSNVDDLADFVLESYKNIDGEKMNADAFNATFGTLARDENLNSNSTWRTNAFEFCELNSGKSCAVLSIFTGDLDYLYSVNGEYLQVPWGACNNSIALSESSRQRLLNTPPTPLVEPYFECEKFMRTTIYDEFSAAVGIIIPLRLLFIVLLAFLLFAISKRDEKFYNTYTYKEKQKALDFLASSLLLVRDGNFDKSNKAEMETLVNLQQELRQLGDIPKFYEVELAEPTSAQKEEPFRERQGSSYIQRGSRDFKDAVENPLCLDKL